jgi:hypothetical protein
MQKQKPTSILRLSRAWLLSALLGFSLCSTQSKATPVQKMKFAGYVTARPNAQTVEILDDQIHLDSGTKLTSEEPDGTSKPATESSLIVGTLIEAEGIWTAKHQFSAEKITLDLRQSAKQLHGSAYLQEEPPETPKMASPGDAELKADGEWLLLSERTKRSWDPTKIHAKEGELAGSQVKYNGVRADGGKIEAKDIELEEAAPADAYKLPHNLEVVPSKDPQTGIPTLEFRRGKKIDGRLKLFPENAVQQYVKDLGVALLPPAASLTKRSLEFRFFVVEDPTINAEALPDGTVIVNTGLLAAVENEAQLAFVLSHETAHVLQVHYWREVRETRPKRVGLIIAGIAGAYFIGDMGVFLAELGMVSVINGHQRELENQADRLGMQNIILHGYDPREAPAMSKIFIERYGSRSTSKVWSNHDSSVLRGSYLTIQLARQYPANQWENSKRNSKAFEQMKEDLGPIKIQ